jgi:hypothetical protein
LGLKNKDLRIITEEAFSQAFLAENIILEEGDKENEILKEDKIGYTKMLLT